MIIKNELDSYLVKDYCHRHAIAQLRSSSHILNIESDCYNKAGSPYKWTISPLCNCFEDELHFVIAHSMGRTERHILRYKSSLKIPILTMKNIIFLVTLEDGLEKPF